MWSLDSVSKFDGRVNVYYLIAEQHITDYSLRCVKVAFVLLPVNGPSHFSKFQR